jgi:hypothetical protein
MLPRRGSPRRNRSKAPGMARRTASPACTARHESRPRHKTGRHTRRRQIEVAGTIHRAAVASARVKRERPVSRVGRRTLGTRDPLCWRHEHLGRDADFPALRGCRVLLGRISRSTHGRFGPSIHALAPAARRRIGRTLTSGSWLPVSRGPARSVAVQGCDRPARMRWRSLGHWRGHPD